MPIRSLTVRVVYCRSLHYERSYTGVHDSQWFFFATCLVPGLAQKTRLSVAFARLRLVAMFTVASSFPEFFAGFDLMEVGRDEVTLRMGKQANRRTIQFALQALLAVFGE